MFEKTYAIGTDDTNDSFKEDFVPVFLPMEKALLIIIIKDTLNFMQNITWRHHEFSKEKFNREHYILFGVTD